MTFDTQELRSWAYAFLRAESRKLRLPHQPGLSLSDVEGHVKSEAQRAGKLPQDTLYGVNNLPQHSADAVREVMWSLVIQGIIVPGIDKSSNNAGFPFFQITEWGKECLAVGEYVPYDTGQYMRQLRSDIAALDSTVDCYLIEALNCFRSGTHLSCAVMTGVASERVLLHLRDEIRKALQPDDRKQRFDSDTSGKVIKRVYKEIWKRLDPNLERLPENLRASVGTELAGIFELIRKTRNDAGHPTGRSIRKEEAFALLQLFPPYAKTVYALIEWLQANSL